MSQHQWLKALIAEGPWLEKTAILDQCDNAKARCCPGRSSAPKHACIERFDFATGRRNDFRSKLCALTAAPS